MNTIYVEGTDLTPLISLTPEGESRIEGKAIPENPVKFFKPLFAWAESIVADEVSLSINLVYFNTSVSKHLMDFFRKLEDNSNIKNISILWHYEEGDDEIYESGEIYQELLERTNFNFVEYAEVL